MYCFPFILFLLKKICRPHGDPPPLPLTRAETGQDTVPASSSPKPLPAAASRRQSLPRLTQWAMGDYGGLRCRYGCLMQRNGARPVLERLWSSNYANYGNQAKLYIIYAYRVIFYFPYLIINQRNLRNKRRGAAWMPASGNYVKASGT